MGLLITDYCLLPLPSPPFPSPSSLKIGLMESVLQIKEAQFWHLVCFPFDLEGWGKGEEVGKKRNGGVVLFFYFFLFGINDVFFVCFCIDSLSKINPKLKNNNK